MSEVLTKRNCLLIAKICYKICIDDIRFYKINVPIMLSKYQSEKISKYLKNYGFVEITISNAIARKSRLIGFRQYLGGSLMCR